MKIQESFTVKAPVEAVWEYLTDPERVAGALPGAKITGQVDDRTYEGEITVKVGPVSPTFKGTIRFERLDEEERVTEISAKGQGLRGVGNAEMTMTGKLEETDDGGTRVEMTSEVTITGMLAQFGRGMIQSVSNQMLKDFTEKMRADLEG